MLAFFTSGAVLGLSAGFAPGPLLALVVAETLQHDLKAGVKVALAPILTDLPIILCTLFVLAKLSHFQHILGFISIVGACFILYLGISNIRSTGFALEKKETTSKSLQRGILANALSPHPYLFWFSVGGPITIKAMATDLAAPLIFIFSFYLLLVGSKVVLAVMISKSRSFLQGNTYIFTMRLLGGILILLAGFLLRDGLKLLGLF